ncbi:MAG TPA: transposase, partial [Caulobacteraceae bacterium]
RRGDEMPDWAANKQHRLAKIRAAKAELEAEARAGAAPSDDGDGPAVGSTKPGRQSAPDDKAPDDKAQRNFTDPDSRIMKTKDGVIQGYNAQAAVDGQAQIIVAQGLTASSSDQAQMAPLLDAIKANTGRNPDEVSADAGYCSEANLRTVAKRRIDGYIATGRQRHGTATAVNRRQQRAGTLAARMTLKLKRAGRRSRYRLRKQIVEPVFGQIKHARGFRQFLLRGLDKVKCEWAIICAVHNLTKLAAAAP